MSSDIEAFLRKLTEQKLGTPLSAEDDDEIIDAEIIEDSEPVVAEMSPLGRGPVGGSRLGGLSASVDEADERMDEHLHKVFDHTLGQLGSKTEPEPAPQAAAGYANFLRSRKSIREAIILSEIINRPEHRW